MSGKGRSLNKVEGDDDLNEDKIYKIPTPRSINDTSSPLSASRSVKLMAAEYTDNMNKNAKLAQDLIHVTIYIYIDCFSSSCFISLIFIFFVN